MEEPALVQATAAAQRVNITLFNHQHNVGFSAVTKDTLPACTVEKSAFINDLQKAKHETISMIQFILKPIKEKLSSLLS